MIARTEIGRAVTTNHPPGYAGFVNASLRPNEKNSTKTIVMTSPTIRPHRRTIRVPAEERRKMIVNARRMSPNPPGERDSKGERHGQEPDPEIDERERDHKER